MENIYIRIRFNIRRIRNRTKNANVDEINETKAEIPLKIPILAG